MKPKNATLDISDLVLDQSFQMRADGLNEEHVRDLADALEAKAGCLPRIVVYEVESLGMVVTDGFHTVEAHKLAGMKTVLATVQKGSLFDATVAAAKANREHLGLKRSNADKRHAVKMLFERLRESKQDWTDKRISDELHVSRTMVSAVRSELEPIDDQEEEAIELPEREAKDGRSYKAEKKPKAKKADKKADWETIPLAEFLDADPFIASVLKTNAIKTAGDLLKKIEAGETMGISAGDIESLRKQCEQVRDAKPEEDTTPQEEEKKAGQPVGFNFSKTEAAFRTLAQSADELVIHYPMEGRATEKNEFLRHLNNSLLVWEKWVKRIRSRS